MAHYVTAINGSVYQNGIYLDSAKYVLFDLMHNNVRCEQTVINWATSGINYSIPLNHK